MGDVINLRLARKRKQRASAETKAAANRLLHGRSRAQKKHDRAEADQVAAHLDGHRLPERETDR